MMLSAIHPDLSHREFLLQIHWELSRSDHSARSYPPQILYHSIHLARTALMLWAYQGDGAEEALLLRL